MKTYCINCGYGNEYSLQKPTHCSRCSANLEQTVAKTIESKVSEKTVINKVSSAKQYLKELGVQPLSKEELGAFTLEGVSDANTSRKIETFLKEKGSEEQKGNPNTF